MDAPGSCPSCSVPVAPGAKFCGECGTTLLRRCSACGAPATGSRFCAECGVPLETPAVAAPVPVAERRVCSVLFCDLVGFTSLSESRDPEQVRELLSSYFEHARTVVDRYGGTIEKFIGDAVMAVWGAPTTTEDDAERAVRAALELVEMVEALGTDLDVPGLNARVGIVTGEVAVTLGAANEGMVAGDAVNTASRLQSAAEAGSVLVDEATRQAAAGAISFGDGGEHALKGKTEPMRLWRAGWVLSGVGGVQRVDGLEAPMVGRDAELRMVKELFHASVDRRVPRLMLVSGVAGVGKSRLGWEFEKYVDGLRQTVSWHRGRCLSYGDGVAFWALAEIVRQRLGIAEGEDTAVATAKLQVGVSEVVPDEATASYVGARLARLLGLTYPGAEETAGGRDELFAGWRLYFERLATVAPVVLLIEDADRADAGMLEFLDALVDWTRNLPIFVLVFARPEIPAAPPGWGVGRNRTVLTLDPLHPDAMGMLLQELVPGMPLSAAAQLSEQAQGIPLYAVETIRSLIDRDVVVAHDGHYRLVGELGALTVPGSLHGLLAARLDALAPAVRALVADASVLGATFSPEGLAAVSGRAETDLAPDLDVLVRRGVLEILADPLSPQRGTYRFAHHLVQQVAYGTLSRRDRKTRHLAAAAHLRAAMSGDGEEVIDVVARHYLDAVAAVPDDLDAATVSQEALDALRRAAARAERTGAPLRGAATYVTAAELAASTGQPDPVTAALWESAAEAAIILGSAYEVGAEYSERAATLFDDAGDRRAAARCRGATGYALSRSGRAAEARVVLEASLAALREQPDRYTVLLLARLGMLEIFQGADIGIQLVAEALETGQSLGLDTTVMAELFGGYAVGLHFRGRDAEAVLYLRESARLAELAGDHGLIGNALVNLSDILTTADPAAGADTAREAVAHATRAGDQGCLEIATTNLCSALLMLGEWDQAAATLAEARSLLGDAGSGTLTAFGAWVTAMRGDGAAAAAALDGLTTLHVSENNQDRSGLRTFRAFAQQALGDDVAALASAREALDAVATLGISADLLRWAWPLAARCAQRLGDADTLEQLLGMLDEHSDVRLSPMQRAERALVRAKLTADDQTTSRVEQAVEVMRELSTPYHLGWALLDLAELADPQRAAGAAAEADAIGERLGCAPLRAAARQWLRAPAQAG